MKEVYNWGIKKVKIGAFFTLIFTFVIWMIFIMVVVLGSYLTHQGKIDIGDITAFIMMAMQLMMRCGLIAATFGAIMSMLGASVKIITIMEY